MPSTDHPRVRLANAQKPVPNRDYVLYWMQAFRRLDRNHALDQALAWSIELKKPLVVYEGLRLDYPWASARHHRFMLDGMKANAKRAKKLGINYWPFVETPELPAKGLLRKLSAKACMVITDDYPAFIVPGQIQSLAAKIDVPLLAIDGNCMVPLSQLGSTVSAAAHLRPRIHKLFAESWGQRAVADPEFPKTVRTKVEPPFETWNPACNLDSFIVSLPIDQTVPPVAGIEGGNDAGRIALGKFLTEKLNRYGMGRNNPDDPQRTAASSLSPFLRHGHLSIQEVVEEVLKSAGDWQPGQLDLSNRGKREGYFHPDANVNSFLDEAMTWRDVGYHWHYRRMLDSGIRNADWKSIDGEKIPSYQDLKSTLPAWALRSLNNHATDSRELVYTLQEWEQAKTHDPLWNAAQTELIQTGRIHNYLRMLWGKKVIEWSNSPEEAFLILEHLNNKYAIDGRDPNSYTGILWCFGLFDRPWAPERKVFGTIRFMSSGNTAKKFKLDGYYAYIKRLTGEKQQASLFE